VGAGNRGGETQAARPYALVMPAPGQHDVPAVAVRCHADRMSSPVEVTALAVNVTIPEALRWTDTRRGQEFLLSTLNVRLLPDGHLATKAYGRPTAGGRGTYVSFPVPDRPELAALVSEAASRAGALWAAHHGLG
jgi:hypothetical protein